MAEPEPTPSPAEPLSALAEATAQVHELFLSYVASGFTRAEALQIVIAIILKGIEQNGSSTS